MNEQQQEDAEYEMVFDRLFPRASNENRCMFLTKSDQGVAIIAADEFRPGYGDRIQYIAWPPRWTYRPKARQHGNNSN